MNLHEASGAGHALLKFRHQERTGLDLPDDVSDNGDDREKDIFLVS
jgi:hypothetical protein